MNVDERMMQRIRIALPRISRGSEDHRVLSYIFQQLQPAGLANRAGDNGDPSTAPLRNTAEERLRRYETEEAAA